MDSSEFKALQFGDRIRLLSSEKEWRVIAVGDTEFALRGSDGGLRIIAAYEASFWEKVTPFFEVGKKYVAKNYDWGAEHRVIHVFEDPETSASVAVLKAATSRGTEYDAVTAEDFENMKEVQ